MIIMSELNILPFQEKSKTPIIDLSEGVFNFKGEVIAPFSMFNVTDEKHFTTEKNNGWQIFISNMPLFDGQYYVFYIKVPDMLDYFYPQYTILSSDTVGECYFLKTNKPLILDNIKNNKVLPVMNLTQAIRLGNIKGLEISKYIYNLGIDINSVLDTDLTMDQCKTIITKNAALYYGQDFNEQGYINVIY